MRKFHDPSSGSLARASDAAQPDPLSDVLRTLRLSGALYFMWDVSWPYVTPVPDGRSFAPLVLPQAQQIISYHVVTGGTCWGGLLGEPPLRLEAGDILLIPHGDAYVISSSAQRCARAKLDREAALGFFRRMADGDLPFVVVDGGGGDVRTHLVCGFLGCDVRPFNPVLAALPRLMRVRPPAAPDRLQALVDYTLSEARAPRPGSRSVLLRLSELMFVEVVRRCLAELPLERVGWLAGLRDPVAGRALLLLHRRPAEPWTLAALAREIGVSRSRLADTFTRIVGQPPMLYLKCWRLQLAARQLADGRAKVAAVALEAGYESEAAFSRAFKRFAGASPAQWRRDAAAR